MTVKAMVRDAYGGPEVLTPQDIDRPVPGPDDVLVRVRAAGVDQGTWHVLSGLPYPGRLVFGLSRPRRSQRVPGMDVAGVVEAVGANVTRFAPGDEVFGTAPGAFAEYASTKATAVALKPARLSFEAAGALAVSGATALKALRGVAAGQRVLVIGAGGGVGSYVVQIAAAVGAEVTAVCGPAKLDLVRSLGAVAAIDYTATELTGEYDVIVDIAGGRRLSALRRLLTPRGTLTIVGTETGGDWGGGLGRSWGALLLSPFVRQRLRAPISLVRQVDLVRLAELVDAGTVTPALDRTFALSDLPAAITCLGEGRARGKIVVTP
jgi:NADPH:quinone reductase-like Zn-dependent oxidoreductase